MPAPKTTAVGLLIAILALAMAGCAGGQSERSGVDSGRNSGDIVLGSDGTTDLDLGQDWDQ